MKIERKPGLKALALALSLSALLLPVSCSKDTTEETESPGETLSGDIPIRFKAAFGEDGTKGLAPATDSTLTNFGLFAAYIPEGGDPDKLNLGYMLNVPYTKTSDGWFDTTPTRYWPVAGTMTFFALTPYTPDIMDLVDIETIQQSRYPTIPWGPDPDPKKQVDICVAVKKNVPRQLTVPMEFHHATSQIYFAANYITLADNEFLIIDTVMISNIIGRKNVTIKAEPPYVEWQADGDLPRTQTYELTRADGHLKEVRLPQQGEKPKGDEIITDDGRLYIVPQTYDAASKDVELVVRYTQYHQEPGIGSPIDTMRHTTLETVIPACEWLPDTRYRFILTINDKTQWLNAEFIPEEYANKSANYFAMVCSFIQPSLTKVEGDVFQWYATVGPDEIPPLHKEVEWIAEPDGYVQMQFKKVYNDPTIRPTDVHFLDRDTVMIKCLKPTSDIPGGAVKITARTTHAADASGFKIAEMMLTIDGKGLTIAPYPTGTVTW